MSNYPVVLANLKNGVLVIGGGEVAARRVEGLLAAGARVIVISPQLSPGLEGLAARGRITVLRRAYQPGDLAGARLAIACTDDPQVNQAVYQEAQEHNVLINSVDNPAHCTFHVPAVVRRGLVSIAISTEGASPALAARLRKDIAAAVGPEYGRLAALLAAYRPWMQAHVPQANRRKALWQEMVDALLPLLREGQEAAARQEAEAILRRAAEG
ncbi:MAG: bifunctional precorrin-2 dehydrogenase/sirohydrochlorin ferrochelatase [Chloroflexota bacterium]